MNVNAAVFAVGSLALAAATWAASPTLDRHVACVWGVTVIDGDTIKCHDKLMRLHGINAPEIRDARCQEERNLGLAAKRRLEELLALADHIPVQTGTRGGFGRGTTAFTVRGRDVAEILVEENLAKWAAKRRDTRAWCERTWLA